MGSVDTAKRRIFKRRFWVPPPALTSSGKKDAWAKHHTRTTSVPLSKKGNSLDARDEFVGQLQGLLDEIRRVKSSEYPKRNLCSRRTADETDAARDFDGEQDLSALTELVIKDGSRRSNGDRILVQKPLGHVVNEPKKVAESASMSGQHSLLIRRLKKIEEDASEAVQHVTAIRQIVKQLNHEAVPISDRSTAQLEKRKELLSKLARLDDANRSLQTLISGISAIDETEAVGPPANETDGRLQKYESELKILQDQAQANRREIFGLKTELSERTAHFNAEKQSLKADVSSHRERANKYLLDFETVSMQLNDKNVELNKAKMVLEKQRLYSSRVHTEHAKMKFENRALQSKLNVLEDKLKEEESGIRVEMNRMESNFHEMSSKASVLELENTKLKFTLSGVQSVVSKQKLEIERLEKAVESSSMFKKSEVPYTKNESIQVELIRGNLFVDKAGGDYKIEETELFVEKEKAAILQQLKQLNKKLETSETLKATFRKELIAKEEIVLKNNAHLQEKIEECNTLKESLEAALKDVRELTSSVQNWRTSDQLAQNKLNELERTALNYRTENERLKTQKDQLERKFTSEIEELRGQLENLRSANATLQEYVNFLRTSYADVFGEFSMRAA